ncbi:hypothetical protein OJAV_G00195610 [Oryzias javanicus]|uniref:Uncharacterized protein n=1 Tax=Oryzias javanicus TaxID=123683 RepID=A0A3S2NWY9_ORYJA|nr:hypothetical protein OJAV_G00195610 [Oryzias javanicus]
MGLLFGLLLLSLFAVGRHHVNAYYTGADKYRGDHRLTPFGPDRYGRPVDQAFTGRGSAAPKKPIISPVKPDYALGRTTRPIKPILAEYSYPMREPLDPTKPVSWYGEPSSPQWEPMDQMKPAPLPVKFKYPGSVSPSFPTEREGPTHPGSVGGPKMNLERLFTSVAPRKPVYKPKRPSDLLKYPRKPRYLSIRTRFVPQHPAWGKNSRLVRRRLIS